MQSVKTKIYSQKSVQLYVSVSVNNIVDPYWWLVREQIFWGIHYYIRARFAYQIYETEQ